MAPAVRRAVLITVTTAVPSATRKIDSGPDSIVDTAHATMPPKPTSRMTIGAMMSRFTSHIAQKEKRSLRFWSSAIASNSALTADFRAATNATDVRRTVEGGGAASEKSKLPKSASVRARSSAGGAGGFAGDAGLEAAA